MAASPLKHFVLVPGFGGFDALGSIDYYEGVVEHLQAGTSNARVHFFSNLPTAAVNTRAEALAVYLAKRLHRGSIMPGEEIHLVAHSTGGLDVRQMIANLAKEPDKQPSEGDSTSQREILESIRSIQFLSVPQRGTNIAYQLAGIWGLPRLAVGGLFSALYLGRPTLARATAKAIQLIRPGPTPPDVVDAAIETLKGFKAGKDEPLKQAESRESFYATLKWLENIAFDGTAIEDLQPEAEGVKSRYPTPARWNADQLKAELELYKNKKIRIQSFITSAERGDGGLNPYNFLHFAICRDPPEKMGGSFTIPKLIGGGTKTIDPTDNDGIVSTVSMRFPPVGPDADRFANHFVDADHGDIIGHYRREPEQHQPGERVYDLLRSGATFTKADFGNVWRAIGAFASSGERDLANAA